MIPLVDLARQHAALKPALLAAAERVLDGSQFVLGAEGRALEEALAAERRRATAARGRELLAGLPLGLPVERPLARHVYHLYCVRHPRRDGLAAALAELGVGTAVHYPLPVPGQPLFGGDGERRWPEAWRAAREELAIPCWPEPTDAEVTRVTSAVAEACERVARRRRDVVSEVTR